MDVLAAILVVGTAILFALVGLYAIRLTKSCAVGALVGLVFLAMFLMTASTIYEKTGDSLWDDPMRVDMKSNARKPLTILIPDTILDNEYQMDQFDLFGYEVNNREAYPNEDPVNGMHFFRHAEYSGYLVSFCVKKCHVTISGGERPFEPIYVYDAMGQLIYQNGGYDVLGKK